ncbi:DUF3576 domain-containing protein [Candidatus Pelagibacter sp.]|nr:DUF3576 domain-containing protein [Candidatus Pelagibacter sp.]MDA9083721.1 DUF3576 domain-containing protein [Candidatus Pelagibacter sp.]
MNKILKFKNIVSIITLIVFSFTINSCGIYRKTDARKIPTNADERIKKNMKEGRGFKFGNIGKGRSGDFQFASSNPLWRASLEKLDFAPLNNVDYAGGIIVTDWFSNENSNNEIKITIRFLTNEIRSDAINVIIHKKVCSAQNNCKITKIDNNLNSEIKFEILKKAAQIKNEDIATIKKETGDIKIPGKNF